MEQRFGIGLVSCLYQAAGEVIFHLLDNLPIVYKPKNVLLYALWQLLRVW